MCRWNLHTMVSLLLACFCSTGMLIAKPGPKTDKQSQASNQTDLRKKYVRPADPVLYVGSDVCQTCHEDIYKGFETTPHFTTTMEAKLEAHKGPEWHGCEACHGPGKEHVEGGGDKTKIFTFKDASPQEASARCLGCHQYSEEHGNYERSAHLLNGVGCIDCHAPHHAKESEFLLKAKSPELCYGCHGDVRAQFARPFHHRVNEVRRLVPCKFPDPLCFWGPALNVTVRE